MLKSIWKVNVQSEISQSDEIIFGCTEFISKSLFLDYHNTRSTLSKSTIM